MQTVDQIGDDISDEARRLAWRPQGRGRLSAPAAFSAVRSLGPTATYFAVR